MCLLFLFGGSIRSGHTQDLLMALHSGWGSEDHTGYWRSSLVGHVQGKHLSCCSISLVPENNLIKWNELSIWGTENKSEHFSQQHHCLFALGIKNHFKHMNIQVFFQFVYFGFWTTPSWLHGQVLLLLGNHAVPVITWDFHMQNMCLSSLNSFLGPLNKICIDSLESSFP